MTGESHAPINGESLEDLADELAARSEASRERCLDLSELSEAVTYINPEISERTTDAMSLFLQEVRRYPLLTRAQEVELAKRLERGDLGAKSQLVNSNLRLVISNARKYQGHE